MKEKTRLWAVKTMEIISFLDDDLRKRKAMGDNPGSEEDAREVSCQQDEQEIVITLPHGWMG